MHRHRVVARADTVRFVECVRLLDLPKVNLDPESWPLRQLDHAAADRKRSFVNRWPSWQIQCVSIAVTRPGAAAATCVNIASEMLK